MSQQIENIDITLIGLDDMMELGNHQIKVFAFGAEHGVADVPIDIQVVSGHAMIMQNSEPFGFLPVSDFSTRTNQEGETFFNLNLGHIGEVVLRLVWKDPSYKRTWERNYTFRVKEKHHLKTEMLFPNLNAETLFPKRELKCVIEAPEERECSGFAAVRVRIMEQDKQPAKGVTVSLESRSENLKVCRINEFDEKIDINTGLTDSNGFITFQLEHLIDLPEVAYFVVLWDADGTEEREDRTLNFKAREENAMADTKQEDTKQEETKETEETEKGEAKKPEPEEEKTEEKAGPSMFFRQQWKALAIIGAAVIVVLAVLGIDYGTDHSIGNWVTGLFGAEVTEVASGPAEAVVPDDTDMVFTESEAAKLDQSPKDVEPPASLLAGLVDKDEESESDDDPTDVPPAQDQPEEAPGLVSVSISEDDGSVEILHPKMWNTLQSVEDLESEVEELALDKSELEKQNSDLAQDVKDLKKELGKPKYVMPKRLDCRDSEWELKPGGVIRLYDCKIQEVGKKKKKK